MLTIDVLGLLLKEAFESEQKQRKHEEYVTHMLFAIASRQVFTDYGKELFEPNAWLGKKKSVKKDTRTGDEIVDQLQKDIQNRLKKLERRD